jgi:hypothetical protein
VDTVEAVHSGGAAEMNNEYRKALQHAERGLGALRKAIEAYARVARTQSDRGAVAMVNEFGCRPLQRKLAELTTLVQDGQ